MRLENSVFAVGGVFVDECEFDEIAKSDALELGQSGLIPVGAIYKGDAIDAVERPPIFCQKAFAGDIFDRRSGYRFRR